MNAVSTTLEAAKLTRIDPVWQEIRAEAELIVSNDPLMGSFVYRAILNHDCLENAIFYRVSEQLRNRNFSADIIRQNFQMMLQDWPEFAEYVRCDIAAFYDRDPACCRLIDPILYFKGFQAIQAYRLTHWNWNKGQKDFALYLQSRVSEVFSIDINPAAKIGRGLFLDHAHAIVVGATARIGDNVSMMHGVTLGGTG